MEDSITKFVSHDMAISPFHNVIDINYARGPAILLPYRDVNGNLVNVGMRVRREVEGLAWPLGDTLPRPLWTGGPLIVTLCPSPPQAVSQLSIVVAMKSRNFKGICGSGVRLLAQALGNVDTNGTLTITQTM